jgi:hypothetical protein
MQALKQDFALIDTREFERVMEQKGFHLVEQDHRTSPAGKTLWLGVFAGHAVDACKVETSDHP